MPVLALRRCITMLAIILCLVHILVTDLGDLFAAFEVQSAVLAFVVFSGLAARLWLNARPRSANSLRNINLLSV